MEKIDITLDKDTVINLPIEKVKKLVRFLEMDEIVDSMTDKNQIDSLIDRLCIDYFEEIAKLLNDFFDHKSDANKYLMADEQENLQNDYKEYLSNRHKSVI